MEDNNTSHMIKLLRRLKKETNGAVVEAMELRGVHYPLSYGVSIPTIQAVAKEYGPDHAFALYLFKQQVRELQLAAVFIDDPKQVTKEQMQQWSTGFVNTEIVEQSVAGLLWKAPEAGAVCLEWVQGQTPRLSCYAGLMLISKSVIQEHTDNTQAEQFLEAIRIAARRSDLDSTLAHGLVNALRNCALPTPSLRNKVTDLLKEYTLSNQQWLLYVAEEVAWQIEEI